MKRTIFIILCAALALCATAETTRLNRADLMRARIIKDRIETTSPSTQGNKASSSLQQFLKENNLTLADNRLNSKSPQRQSIEEFEEIRIASSEAYNFEWDSINQIAIVDESPCALMGSYSQITCSPVTGDISLSFYYDDFQFPIDINPNSNSVTIKAGLPLASMATIESFWPDDRNVSSQEHVVVVWTLYAMPLNWLEGDDDYDDIHGEVETNGTITFNDDFAFLIKAKIQGEERATYLSPIFKNLTLYRPNGRHTFSYSRMNADDEGFGHGGLVPRKPGKPVSPRPISSIVEANNPNYNSNRFDEIVPDTHLSQTDKLQSVVSPWSVYLPDGHGVQVPRGYGELSPKPGSSKPTSTGPFNNFVNGREPEIDINPMFKTGDAGSIDPDSIITTFEQVPVYVDMPNDTLLMVYNLFGLGNCCYVEINKLDGTMRLPAQEIYNDGLGDVGYNNESTGEYLDNIISWWNTKMYDNNGNYLVRKFDFNSVTFTDSLPPKPVFINIEMETQVRISALVRGQYQVYLYMYDAEANGYTEVEGSNSVVLPRQNEAYWVYLAAKAYDPATSFFSDIAWFEYEVPALETSIILGDVNGDSEIAINDVTCLINALLTGEWDDIHTDACDMNKDGEISITDVTILINYLLTGVKPY